MYHIKSDRRSQTSAQEIVRGLGECLKTIPLKAVTVTDIHRATGISRATFYRLFDTPEDVLIYQLDQMTDETIEWDYNEEKPSRQLMMDTIAMGLQNHEFLKALVANGRHDLLFRYTEKSFRRLDEHKKIFPEGMEPGEREYFIAHLSMAMVAGQIIWSRNGQKETPEDILRYIRRYTQVMMVLLGE